MLDGAHFFLFLLVCMCVFVGFVLGFVFWFLVVVFSPNQVCDNLRAI